MLLIPWGPSQGSFTYLMNGETEALVVSNWPQVVFSLTGSISLQGLTGEGARQFQERGLLTTQPPCAFTNGLGPAHLRVGCPDRLSVCLAFLCLSLREPPGLSDRAPWQHSPGVQLVSHPVFVLEVWGDEADEGIWRGSRLRNTAGNQTLLTAGLRWFYLLEGPISWV